MQLNLVSAGYLGRSTNISASRMVNFYPELTPDGKSVAALIGTPGYTMFANIGGLPMRGMHVFNSLLYVVQGGKLYSINNVGVVSTALGTLKTSSGKVSMVDNGLTPTGGNQLMIVDGVGGYIYNVNSGVFTTLTNATHGFPTSGANTVTFMDGYFICDVAGSSPGTFVVSNLYNGLTWNAINTSTADADPDVLVTVKANNRELWLFGDSTTEVWYDAGSGYPPFARMPGGVIEHGIAARWSVAKWGNNLFWIAKGKNGGGYAVMNAGYDVKRISTPALEYQWSTYLAISDARGFIYSDQGHIFWVIAFSTGNATWVYDVTTDMWHERSSYTGSPFVFGRHVADSYAYFNGMHLIGDYLDGDIYQWSSTVYTDNGNAIVSMRTIQHISEELKTIFFNRLQIDMEMGIGDQNYASSDFATFFANGTFLADGTLLAGGSLLPGTSVNPQVILTYSDDGGHTWSDERWTELGKLGEYTKRTIWRRLGRSRDRIFRVTISDPVKKILIGGTMELTKGTH